MPSCDSQGNVKMIKKALLGLAKSAAAKTLRRELVMLPLSGTETLPQGSRLLPLRYTYRASLDGFIEYQLLVAGNDLQYDLYAMGYSGRQPVPGPHSLSLKLSSVTPQDTLRVHLTKPAAWFNGELLRPISSQRQTSRKFIAQFQLVNGRDCWSRSCSHYLPFDDKPIGHNYYFGDDYSAYPLHVQTEPALQLVRQYCQGGRLLDVGCALGIYTKAFLDAGFDACGVDISEYAVKEAAKRLSPDRARQVNLDQSDVPYDGSFDVIWMHDVLEHSANPHTLLKKVTNRAAANANLFLSTSNADSLTHRLLGDDWEGYSDYSHYGVQKVTATILAGWLKELGWKTLQWDCTGIWFSGVDPVLSRLQIVLQGMPELVTFLSERQLGDAISVVARKQ